MPIIILTQILVISLIMSDYYNYKKKCKIQKGKMCPCCGSVDLYLQKQTGLTWSIGVYKYKLKCSYCNYTLKNMQDVSRQYSHLDVRTNQKIKTKNIY